MEYTLAIDQGTHASRALVLDARGRPLASRLVPVDLTRPHAGRAEQAGEQIVNSVRTAVRGVLDALTREQRGALSRCGLCTQRSTVLAWGEDGAALSPALSWQDTRGESLVTALGPHGQRIQQLSGLPLSAHYGASKLNWLQRNLATSDQYRMGPLAAYLLCRLTRQGHHRVDHGNAQRLQLLDVRQCRWSPALLDWFGIQRQRLPEPRPVIDDYGNLIDDELPLTAVCGDQNAAWFADGQVDDANALINLGSGAFILAAPGAHAPPLGLLTSIAVSDRQGCDYLSEATVNGAASALQWLQQRYPGSDIFGQLGRWLTADITPPIFINSVGGLGSPWWVTNLEPVFVPDTARLTLAERALAVTESILFLLAINLQQLQTRTPIERLRVSGGLSRLDPLCQKLADLCDLDVLRSPDNEASARGVAWLAAGRPAEWGEAATADRFVPRRAPALQARYRGFRDYLQQRLDRPSDA